MEISQGANIAGSEQLVSYQQGANEWTFTFNLQNSGNTAAENVSLWDGACIYPDPKAPLCAGDTTWWMDNRPGAPESSGAIPPHTPIFGIPLPIQNEILSRAWFHESEVFLFMYIKYETIFPHSGEHGLYQCIQIIPNFDPSSAIPPRQPFEIRQCPISKAW